MSNAGIPHHKVLLFGSKDLSTIPQEMANHIAQIIEVTKGDVEFIVSDAPGIATSLQKLLAMLGCMNKTTVYTMDVTKNNTYDMPERKFTSKHNADKQKTTIFNPEGEELAEIEGVKNEEDIYANPAYYDVRDKEMCRDCTFAICFWDGMSRSTLRNVDRLKAQQKAVYIYQAKIY